MKISESILMPDTTRKPFFDGDDLKSSSYEFKCLSCNTKIIVNCFSIYTGSWQRDFSEEVIKIIEDHFSFSSDKNISLNGGWPSITKHYCLNCGIPYIVVADFHEYRNSVYKITMQGIAKCW